MREPCSRRRILALALVIGAAGASSFEPVGSDASTLCGHGELRNADHAFHPAGPGEPFVIGGPLDCNRADEDQTRRGQLGPLGVDTPRPFVRRTRGPARRFTPNTGWAGLPAHPANAPPLVEHRLA